MQPIVGRLSDRWGRESFVFWGLLLLVPTTLAQGMAADPWQMLFARRGQSGFQLAILTMSFGLGLSGGQLTAGFLVGMGYVAPFAFGSFLALAAAWVVRSEVVEARG